MITFQRFMVHAERRMWDRSVEIFIGIDQDGDNIKLAKPIEFAEVPRMSTVIAPAIKLGDSTAQELMDELWKCGLRPSEGTGSAGALAAVEKHLGDMREITFAMLEAKGFKIAREKKL